MDFKMNINTYVKVKLTDFGISILKQEHDAARAKAMRCSGKDLGEFKLSLDEEGYYKAHFWLLMKQFGHVIDMGGEAPFKEQLVVVNGQPIEQN